MYELTTLDNGLRLLTVSIPHVRSASIGFFIGVGSRFESDAPFPIYGLFRQADQLLKHHSRINQQASELLEWLHSLEPEIRDYQATKEEVAKTHAQREKFNQVIQECEAVIEASQTEIPRLKDLVQQYGALYIKLKESPVVLRDWLQGVIRQSLDPEFMQKKI